MASLAALVNQSRNLADSLAPPSASSLPALQLSLDQIASSSRLLAAQHPHLIHHQQQEPGEHQSGHYLLAKAGVDASRWDRQVREATDLAQAFEPLSPLADADVPGYLRHIHEQAIISTIEESRRSTSSALSSNLAKFATRSWADEKASLSSELGLHASTSTSTSAYAPGAASNVVGQQQQWAAEEQTAGGELQNHAKMMRLDRVIRRLNAARKTGEATFPVVDELWKASRPEEGGAVDAKSSLPAELWSLLSSLVPSSLPLRSHASAHAAGLSSPSSIALRETLTSRSLLALEHGFMQHVERTLAARPVEAALGGEPSVAAKLGAYARVRFFRAGAWTVPGSSPAGAGQDDGREVEMVDGAPAWTRVWYFLRAGKRSELLSWAETHERAFTKLEREFVPSLRALERAKGEVEEKMARQKFEREFVRLRGQGAGEWKLAVYKLLGKADAQRRNVGANVAGTTEDWLFVQLSLCSELPSPSAVGKGPANGGRGLRELASDVKRYGRAHFDPDGRRPQSWAFVLLVAGEFERAVAALWRSKALRTEAAHVAVALAYAGLLRLPKPGQERDEREELLAVEEDVEGWEKASLDFEALIGRYIGPFVSSDPAEAVQYLYLLTLFADLGGTDGKAALDAAREGVREVVGRSRAWRMLLGDVRSDGTRVPGAIAADMALLGLKSEGDYLASIVRQAAERAAAAQRTDEAVLLFNLAEEYDAVLSVLLASLGGQLGAQGPEVERAWQQAREVVGHYEQTPVIRARVSRRPREAIETLLRLREGVGAAEAGKWAQGLEFIESTGVVPLQADLVGIIRAADALKDTDEAVVRNLDLVLLAAMNCLYRLHAQLKESPYGDKGRQNQMNELKKKARALMTFAGMGKYKVLSSETHQALARLDVFIQ